MLTATDTDQFRDQGWFVVENLFSTDECARIIERIETIAFELQLGQADDGPLSYRPMMTLNDPELQAAAADRRWADVVLPLLGDSARLYWEQAVAKPPQARTELPWHQDNGYAPTIPEEYVTCWLALDDADEENGCIWVQPGSHRQGTLQHHGTDGPFRAGYDGEDAGIPVPVAAGSVLVFSSLVMHRSGPNVTDRHRRAWIIQYCPADAIHANTKELLDDRLLVAEGGRWLDEPVRQRPLDLLKVFREHNKG
ncbi:MAG TPA: phytanoyl-CoA dioxygenase family protein [Acidimicrobiales bacterium]|nr:phytanoyl-CoA dioxygenase family protein [Acidimicrobiales bacterium]